MAIISRFECELHERTYVYVVEAFIGMKLLEKHKYIECFNVIGDSFLTYILNNYYLQTPARKKQRRRE